jgi:hypothetical protein
MEDAGRIAELEESLRASRHATAIACRRANVLRWENERLHACLVALSETLPETGGGSIRTAAHEAATGSEANVIRERLGLPLLEKSA